MGSNERLREALTAAGLTHEQIAARLQVDPKTVYRWVVESRTPYPRHRAELAELVGRPEAELWPPKLQPPPDTAGSGWTTVSAPDLVGVEAIELVRRIEASDTGPATIDAIERGVDRLCRSYTHTAPDELLVPLTAYQGYVGRLLDGRVTLTQRRQLMASAGWLSLLIATADIDLGLQHAAAANLAAARSLAAEVGDDSLAAWVFETVAWQALTDGRPADAVDACQAGLQVAPPDTSGHVQLCIQQARATGRLGRAQDTYRLLEECSAALDRMPTPHHPEHHYVFDPRRFVAYSATALVWLADDDTLAEEYARRAVEQYDIDAPDGRWVHRLALARITLGQVLARQGQPTEAAHHGTLALDSWRLVRSDISQAADLDRVLKARYPGSTEATEYHGRFVHTLQELDAGDGRPAIEPEA